MKKFLLMVAVAATALLADSQFASARRNSCGGCGGGKSCHQGRRHHGRSNCRQTSGCGTCTTGCGVNTCSTCGTSGCATCGVTSVVGGTACASGVCTVGAAAAFAQAEGNEATLVVTLPEDATLIINDTVTTSQSSQRVFVTPALEQGKEYQYNLKAQIVRDGQVQTITAKATVQAGKTSTVELKANAAGVAAQ
jgi:uncharacterized protein (TIGR03000 family)